MNKFIFFFWCFAVCGLEVEISSPSALLMNAETGKVLYEKNAHEKRCPASTTKIGTLLFVLDQKKPIFEAQVKASPEALRLKNPKSTEESSAYWGEVDGTRMGILTGEILTIDSLLHGLVLVSGNDAANVLAESFSSSIPHFLNELNGYLHDIGCIQTQFSNPHGLHHDLHMTTAYDIALMMKKGLQIPKFRELMAKPLYARPKTNKQKSSEMVAVNPLLKKGHKQYDSRVIAGKTGYHSKAGYNLVAAAEQNGRTLIAVLFGGAKRTCRYEDAKRLFDAAFKEALVAETLFNPKHLFLFSRADGEKPLGAVLRRDLSITYFPSEKPICKAHVHWDPIELPIKQGERVGEVRISDSFGKVLQIGELVAQKDVDLTWTASMKKRWNKIKNFTFKE
jgi:D-alanyl-D-alanine carboxypeptidase (penicillin-binding protein 5/6)